MWVQLPANAAPQALCPPVDGIAVAHPLSLQSDVDAVVADLVKQLHSGDSRQKAVRPKALLDNCLKVLRMLFGAHCECWGRQQGWGEVSVVPFPL